MSREIKFRAQRSDNKEFVYGFYYKGKRADQTALDTPLGFARLFSSIITEEGVIFDVLERTVGQFTGLKDKNGREIYEGDIVKFVPISTEYHDEFLGSIFYRESEAAFYHTFEEGRPSKRFFNTPEWKLEVVGTIFNNENL